MNRTRPVLQTHSARPLASFEPFAEFPLIPAAQLDHLLSSLKIQPISALEWEWPIHWTVPKRVVNDSLFFWFQRGSGTFWARDPGNSFRYQSGDLMLIPQGIPHMVSSDDPEESKVYAIHFYATLFGGIDFLELLGFPYKLSGRHSEFFRITCEDLSREFAVKSPGWQGAMVSLLHNFLLHAIRTAGNDFRNTASVASHEEIPRLFPVVEWIDQHLEDNNISVRDLARRVYLSETHFRRLFKQVFNTSPIKFIRNRRIDHACTLLRTTRLNVKEISQQCGFNDTSFFSRVFRSVTGKTPASYRHSELL